MSDFEGAVVRAKVDGYYQGPFTVSSGSIGLAFGALTNGTAIVGRWTLLVVTTMPVPRDVAPEFVSRRPCRVHTLRINVVESENLAVTANGSPAVYDVPMQFLGDATDTPPSAALS